MAANENALTQPKFELRISGIIHNVFQGDQTTKFVWKQIDYFPREGGVGGGYPSMENSMEIIIFFFETFPK